jgi:hypothetical protein
MTLVKIQLVEMVGTLDGMAKESQSPTQLSANALSPVLPSDPCTPCGFLWRLDPTHLPRRSSYVRGGYQSILSLG